MTDIGSPLPKLAPLPDTQVADQVLQERTAAASSGPVMQALRRQLSGESSAAPAGEKPAPTPAPGGAAAPPADPAAGGGDAGGVDPDQKPLGMSQLIQRERQANTRTWLDFAETVYTTGRAIAGDVAGGAVEIHRTVPKGMLEGVSQLLTTANDVTNWLGANSPWVGAEGKKKMEALAAENPLGKMGEAAGEMADWIEPARTFTGHVVEVVSQFLTGDKVLGPLAKALSLPMSTVGRLIKDAAVGATAFDPQAPRAANAIDDLAPNALTDFLKAKPGDGDAEGRLKTALETGAGALAVDGVIKGLKLLQQARATAKDAAVPSGSSADALPKPAAAAGAAAKERDWLPIGDPKLPLVDLSPEIKSKLVEYKIGAQIDNAPQINLARIAGPEDVQKIVDGIARQLPKTEPQDFATIAQGARELGLTPDEVMAGLQGGALDARQITASRMMMHSAATQLQELAGKAAGVGASEADLAAFNRAYALTYGLMQQVKGSSAEIGRALSAHRILAQSEPDAVKAIRNLLDEAGGPDAARDMAQKIATLNDPRKISELIGEAARGTTRDNISFAYMNLLVSNPASHVANLAGNTTASAINIWERWLAGRIDAGIRRAGVDPGDGVEAGEALAQMYGMRRGTWDGLTAGARTLRTGAQDFGMAKEIGSGSAIGVGTEAAGGANSWLKMLLPARWLGAEDQVFKWMNYRGELARLAFKEGQANGLAGDAMRRHIDEVLAHPPRGLHEDAAEAAKRLTFNADPGPAMQKIQGALKEWTLEVRPGIELPVGKVVMPFVSTPYNIARWTLERTPGIGLVLRDVRADLAAGGARMEMAMAKQATGAALAGIAWELVQQGTLTGGGPQNAELRGNLTRQGWQPYSIKVGNRYVAIDRLDTPGQLMGAIADVADVMTWAKDEDREDLSLAITLAASRAVMSRSYLSGIAGMVNAMTDPERYGDSFTKKLAGSAVPAIVGNAAQAADPVRRSTEPGHSGDSLADEIREMGNAIRARTPGLSQDLPPMTDLWGNDLRVAGAYLGVPGTGIEMNPQWARLLSPFKLSEIKVAPIDAEMTRLRLKISPVREGMPWPGLPQGVQLEPKELYRYARLQGQEVRDPRTDLNLQDTLNAMVEGAGPDGATYARLNDDGKAMLIRSHVQGFRELARLALVKEFPDLRQAIDEATEAMRQAAQPGAGGSAPAAGPVMTPDNTRSGTKPVRALPSGSPKQPTLN